MAPPVTHTKNSFSLHRKTVNIIELGKGLFNKESPILMPGRLKNDDGPSDELSDMNAVSAHAGITALAAAYKQFEFDARKQIVIAGHAAGESGDVKKHFDLAALRARNVYLLLTGQREQWAAGCYAGQKLEDVKRILMYFALRRLGWDCRDKGGINANWTDDTTKATEKFIAGYNKDAKHAVKLAAGLAAGAAKDKKWSPDLWKAVFTLYQEDICTSLKIAPPDPAKLPLRKLRFAMRGRECVACGESFPLKVDKSGYQKDKYRRVDIMFWNPKEVPGVRKGSRRFVCPAAGAAAHQSKECPIWYQKHIKAVYLDPDKELKLIAYHLTFTYYDKIAGKVDKVPGGLTIEAYHYVGVGAAKTLTPIDAMLDYSDGVYTLKVEDDSTRKNIFFQFNTQDPAKPTTLMWVFRKDQNAEPVIVEKQTGPVKSMGTAERFKYYDLPKLWSSENYWTRYKSGNDYEAFRYDTVMKTKKTLKPYGGKTTAATDPLFFSLNDIVLIKADGSQIVKDKDAADVEKALSADSRVTLLYLDKDDKFKVKIYAPRAEAPYFSKPDFTENLIYNYHPSTRAVIFCGDFYHAYDKRTEKTGTFDFAKKHVLGARAALINDADISAKESFILTTDANRTNAYSGAGCGNYDLHFIYRCGLSKGKNVSALILYWSGSFKKDAANGGTDADAQLFLEKGLLNAMNRNNAKDYTLAKHTGTRDMLIKMFIFYEGKHKDRGGKPKCVLKVRDNNGGSSIGAAAATYRKGAAEVEAKHFQAGPTAPADPLNSVADYDGSKTKRLVGAHESGHASGWDDEYLKFLDDKDALPSLQEMQGYYKHAGGAYYHGAPYSLDKLTIMSSNHAVRMRHFWYYVNWLNDMGQATKPLHKFLDGTKFKITFKDLNYELITNRKLHESAHQKDYYSFTADSKADMILYKLGEDEFAKTITSGQTYTGILIVRTNLSARFTPGASWTDENQVNWLGDLHKRINVMLNKKYRLACTGDADHAFKNVALHFMPHYEIRGGAASMAGMHFKLEVKDDTAGTFTPAGTTITVSKNVAMKKVIRYFFGKTTGADDLGKADLTKITDWMADASVTGKAFAFREL